MKAKQIKLWSLYRRKKFAGHGTKWEKIGAYDGKKSNAVRFYQNKLWHYSVYPDDYNYCLRDTGIKVMDWEAEEQTILKLYG